MIVLKVIVHQKLIVPNQLLQQLKEEELKVVLRKKMPEVEVEVVVVEKKFATVVVVETKKHPIVKVPMV